MKNTIKFDRIIQMAHARIEPLSEKEKDELKERWSCQCEAVQSFYMPYKHAH